LILSKKKKKKKKKKGENRWKRNKRRCKSQIK